MSKYIRTEYGIYEEQKTGGGLKYFELKIIGGYYNLAEADTIEELCDEFHIEYDSSISLGKINYVKYYDFEIAKYNLEDNETLYGVIHIKGKGLIYVAKMNEKGELELI